MDIFLAYSRRNRKKAETVKQALESAGFTVFVDTTTPTGTNWRNHIVEQLDKSKLVIVLWSVTSVESRYVLEEAEEAVAQDKFYPVMITPCTLPYGFKGYQARDLLNWTGDISVRKWVELVDEVRDRLHSIKARAGKSSKAKPRSRTLTAARR